LTSKGNQNAPEAGPVQGRARGTRVFREMKSWKLKGGFREGISTFDAN
jgi:hypothetical protein